MHFVNTVDLSKSLNLLKFSLESMTVLLSSYKQLQWNFDLTKCQGTGKLVRYIEVLFHTLHYYWDDKYRTLYRGLRYIEVRYIEVFSIHYTITGMKNIVRYTEDFAI